MYKFESVNTDKGIFYRCIVGSESHQRPSFTFWVNRALIHENERGLDFANIIRKEYNELYFAIIPNSRLVRTEKGSLVLRPNNEFITVFVEYECGYRGSSKIEIVPEPLELMKFYVYSSPRGSLGVSMGCLFSTPVPARFRIKGERTGRTYGQPHNVDVVFAFANNELTIAEYVEDIPE